VRFFPMIGNRRRTVLKYYVSSIYLRRLSFVVFRPVFVPFPVRKALISNSCCNFISLTNLSFLGIGLVGVSRHHLGVDVKHADVVPVSMPPV